MNVNQKQNDTEQQDLNDFFVAMRLRDPIFMMAIGLTTRSEPLRKRLADEVTNLLIPLEKENCKAEIIKLPY